MIRCIPVDGSPPFEISVETRCIGRRTTPDASLRPPHVSLTAEVRILEGVVAWPFEVASAVIHVDGHDEEDNCVCAEHAIYCDQSGIEDDGYPPEQNYVERPDGTWLACHLESWRERAERLEREMNQAVGDIAMLYAHAEAEPEYARGLNAAATCIGKARAT